ncbi:beta-1,3-glucanosyltransferase [Pseudozyma hubeiensis SY62]|uniref:Beta-1,3-glucanosyltransferase n=1 Tax=Pseudozyma hubeiensis (strain SY62) TaxID=1305764 RepID=R9PAY1_PSEHS|nr:beta-1,3-glucanosyltransferase [Pseudozyma hubeiensis SY62]GAC98563.1 beta-1,3-glucanosyltransferase [Pseudozyma hubeiensis SY62]
MAIRSDTALIDDIVLQRILRISDCTHHEIPDGVRPVNPALADVGLINIASAPCATASFDLLVCRALPRASAMT